MITLTCCCCGEPTRGKQWHNRDTGYGMCPKCIAWVRRRGMPESEIRDLYGIEGINFPTPEPAQQDLKEPHGICADCGEVLIDKWHSGVFFHGGECKKPNGRL